MQTNNIPANRAVDWYKQAWGLFSKDMTTWVLMTLLLGVGAIVLNILPIIGQIILLVLMPSLIGGLLFAAKEASEGKPVKLEYLWSVLKSSSKRNEFLALGGIMFAVFVTIGIISAAFVGDSLLRGASSGLMGFGIGGMLFMLVVGFASFVLFNYTPALMLFRDMPLFDALKACAATASTQVVPLLVFFLIYAVISFIASIPFGLGLLVVIPLTSIAVYLSHKELFV